MYELFEITLLFSNTQEAEQVQSRTIISPYDKPIAQGRKEEQEKYMLPLFLLVMYSYSICSVSSKSP